MKWEILIKKETSKIHINLLHVIFSTLDSFFNLTLLTTFKIHINLLHKNFFI